MENDPSIHFFNATEKKVSTSGYDKKKRIKMSLIISLVFIIFISFLLYWTGAFDGMILSKYNGKVYGISSIDGKVSGTITTTVSACSETEKCVTANYDVILNDTLPANRSGSYGEKDSYFDANYYYVANIYNNNMDNKEYSFDSNLEPIDKGAQSSDKFEIKFKKILYKYKYQPDVFLKLTHLDIYDISNSAYMDSHGSVNGLAPLKSTDKIKSYDFIVDPNGKSIQAQNVSADNTITDSQKSIQQTNPSKMVTDCKEAKSPEDITWCFYDESIRYMQAVKQNGSMGLFSGGPGDEYVIRKELEDNQTAFYKSDYFKKNIPVDEKMKGYQYVICASQLPISFSIQNVDTKNTEAVASIEEDFGSYKKTIQAYLKQDTGLWKIYKVYCLQ